MSSFNNFIENLQSCLQDPLPGFAAHAKLMHNDRLISTATPNDETRNSAVLILFYEHDHEVYMPLILRPNYNGTHGGQMAFPGGKEEFADKNLMATALREAEEEIGINADDVKILGELSEFYIPVSNFKVKPFVGFIDYKPTFTPDPKEVEKIFEVKFSHFFDDQRKGLKIIKANGREMEVPGFNIQGQWIWGATAIIISELTTILM